MWYCGATGIPEPLEDLHLCVISFELASVVSESSFGMVHVC